MGRYLKFGPIVLAAILATLMPKQRAAIRAGVKVEMLTEKFEPYGEPLPEFRSGNSAQPKATSAVLSAVGQYSFWLLVAVIVFTRIAFFSPVPSFSNQAFSDQAFSDQSVLALISNAER